jgi:hypothetical protein
MNLTIIGSVNLITDAERHAQLLAEWQERVISEEKAAIRSDKIWAWAEYNSTRNDFFVEGMIRTDDQIYRSFFRVEKLDHENLMRSFAEREPFARPARLGDVFNGFFNTCTLALFLDYCRRFCLDAQELMFAAYGHEDFSKMPEESQEYTLNKAIWEGIEFPEFWRINELKQLQKMLDNINYNDLGNQIKGLETIGVYEGCQTEITQPSLLNMTDLPLLSA